MSQTPGGDHTDAVLEDVVAGLSHGENLHEHDNSFAPNRREVPDGDLPGRKPGTHLAKSPSPTVGPAAVILDCGTSRRPTFSHVLLISPAAPHVLGEHGASRLGEVINTISGVEGFEWEGDTRLHLRAADFAHADLLREARVIVALMLA